MTSAHIINHTHWDREWFLTHEYTTAWIPMLIDSLEGLVERNPNYEFLFDGQTLVIEDLLATRPEYRSDVHELVKNGSLTIGPLYSQPDWRMVSGELHLRNLLYGTGDAEALGGTADVAWLVDTFGHISQAPQMLALAGVDAAYVWRGVPEMTPLFRWVGADGTVLPSIDLFGGYRNLYGISKTPRIAVDRLVAEVQKLAGSYGDVPIPLFDGYDLDTEPEDPVLVYEGLGVPESIEVHESSPRAYVAAVRDLFDGAPEIVGELLSGKYGSTFPGSLSSRVYLTVGQHDAESALHERVEPLATLAAAAGLPFDGETYERQNRTLLQNGVHDCLCGVSIDPVHERMERSYRQMLEWADGEQARLVSATLAGFRPGTYAVSTSSVPADSTVRTPNGVAVVSSSGVGVSPVTMHPIDVVGDDTEQNPLLLDDGTELRFVVRADDGDTYSSEPGAVLGELLPLGAATVVDRSAVDETVGVPLGFRDDARGIEATAQLTVRRDGSELTELQVDLDSSGTGFRIDLEVPTGVISEHIWASMPYDVVARPHEETDLLGHEIDPEMASILMGQRETGSVTEFPFHDFVAMSDGTTTAAVLAKGLRSYRSSSDGTIVVTLRRSTEWLALTGLRLRAGDAGPMMYVPGARCERTVSHRLGFARLAGSIDDSGLHELSATFQTPPTIAEVGAGPADGPDRWDAFASPLPLGSLMHADGTAVARFHNPRMDAVTLAEPLQRCSLRGDELGSSDVVGSKEIVTAAVGLADWPGSSARPEVTVLTPVINRVGPNRSQPAAEEMVRLDVRIDDLERQLAATLEDLAQAEGDDEYRLTHRQYVVERELLELRLSRELNQRRAQSDDEVSIPDAADPVIAQLGWELNELRVKRRIYDYVVVSLGS